MDTAQRGIRDDDSSTRIHSNAVRTRQRFVIAFPKNDIRKFSPEPRIRTSVALRSDGLLIRELTPAVEVKFGPGLFGWCFLLFHCRRRHHEGGDDEGNRD